MSEIYASVIIPHYRCPTQLQKCLTALIKQDFSLDSFEIIVVQNEALPLNLSPSLSQHVKIFYEPQAGSYRARNTGVQNSSGSCLFFTDSDCIPATNWLSKGMEHIARGHSVIGGHIELFFHDPNSPKTIEHYEKVFYFNQNISLNEEHYAATANLIVVKDVFHQVGPFDASLMSGGDREWGRRAYRNGYPTAYLSNAVVFHPSRTGILESLQRRIRVASNDLYIRMRKYGLTPEGKAVLKNKLITQPTPETWPANWEYFYSLNTATQKKVLNLHKLFSYIDYFIVIIGSFSHRALKMLTRIDRLRLK